MFSIREDLLSEGFLHLRFGGLTFFWGGGDGVLFSELYGILLDVLMCSITVYFYELCSILTRPHGESKYKQQGKIYSDTVTTNQNIS